MIMTWFRFRCKITNNINRNTLSTFKNNMQCRHCNTREDKPRENLVNCESTKDLRHNLLWRKISNKLKSLYREANLNTPQKVNGPVPPLKLMLPEEADIFNPSRFLRGIYSIHRMRARKLVTSFVRARPKLLMLMPLA